MRTTVEMPDELLERIKIRAAQNGITVKTFLILAAEQKLHETPPAKKVRRPPPVIHISASLADLTPEQRDDAMFGPIEHGLG